MFFSYLQRLLIKTLQTSWTSMEKGFTCNYAFILTYFILCKMLSVKRLKKNINVGNKYQCSKVFWSPSTKVIWIRDQPTEAPMPSLILYIFWIFLGHAAIELNLKVDLNLKNLKNDQGIQTSPAFSTRNTHRLLGGGSRDKY